MKHLFSALILTATLTTGTAQAGGLYVGGKYMQISTDLIFTENYLGDTETISVGADPTGLALSLGNEISPNIAIEGTLLIGGSDDSFGGFVNIEVDRYLDISVIGQNKLSPVMTVYGRAGLASIEFKDSLAEAEGTGLSFGFGAKFLVQPGLSVFVEWMQLPDADFDQYVEPGIYTADRAVEADTLNFGIQVRL